MSSIFESMYQHGRVSPFDEFEQDPNSIFNKAQEEKEQLEALSKKNAAFVSTIRSMTFSEAISVQQWTELTPKMRSHLMKVARAKYSEELIQILDRLGGVRIFSEGALNPLAFSGCEKATQEFIPTSQVPQLNSAINEPQSFLLNKNFYVNNGQIVLLLFKYIKDGRRQANMEQLGQFRRIQLEKKSSQEAGSSSMIITSANSTDLNSSENISKPKKEESPQIASEKLTFFRSLVEPVGFSAEINEARKIVLRDRLDLEKLLELYAKTQLPDFIQELSLLPEEPEETITKSLNYFPLSKLEYHQARIDMIEAINNYFLQLIN